MTQKERLVQLIIDSVNGCARNWAEVIADHLLANGVVVIDTDVVSMKNRPLISSVASLPIDEVIDLVKAKEEGRLIVPPCKVGSKVYFADNEHHSAFIGNIVSYSLDAAHLWFNCHYECGLNIWHPIEDFGKTVFLTREEAEKALAERSKE